MSRSATTAETEPIPEVGVRNSSQWATTLHRLDPATDDLSPACGEAERDADWIDVQINAYLPVYELCENPECFGGEVP